MAQDERMHVYVRVRPLIARELHEEKVVYAEDEQKVAVESSVQRASLEVDKVFPPHATQSIVYDQLHDCICHAVDGYNSTVFAYGQTASGKTYTLFGPEHDSVDRLRKWITDTAESAGIIPRAIRALFNQIQQRSNEVDQDGHDVQYTVYCSFLQIYNERLHDLLIEPQNRTVGKQSLGPQLAVHESDQDGVYVEGLSEYLVTNPKDCLAIVAQGARNRAIRSTFMNENSSRSHSILQLQIERQVSGATSITRSKLNLVDLAGSERWFTDRNHEMNDEHITELTKINLSLHTLSRCISALADNAREEMRKSKDSKYLSSAVALSSNHLPYRDSKLTHLLKDSLGGNAKTRVIVTLSPAASNLQETLNSLMFADSARKVMTHARVNTEMIPDRILVKQLQAEVSRLRKELLQIREIDQMNANKDQMQQLTELDSIKMRNNTDRIEQLEEMITQLEHENASLKESTQISTFGNVPIQVQEHLKSASTATNKLELALQKFFAVAIEEDDLKSVSSNLLDILKSSLNNVTEFAMATASISTNISNTRMVSTTTTTMGATATISTTAINANSTNSTTTVTNTGIDESNVQNSATMVSSTGPSSTSATDSQVVHTHSNEEETGPSSTSATDSQVVHTHSNEEDTSTNFFLTSVSHTLDDQSSVQNMPISQTLSKLDSCTTNAAASSVQTSASFSPGGSHTVPLDISTTVQSGTHSMIHLNQSSDNATTVQSGTHSMIHQNQSSDNATTVQSGTHSMIHQNQLSDNATTVPNTVTGDTTVDTSFHSSNLTQPHSQTSMISSTTITNQASALQHENSALDSVHSMDNATQMEPTPPITIASIATNNRSENFQNKVQTSVVLPSLSTGSHTTISAVVTTPMAALATSNHATFTILSGQTTSVQSQINESETILSDHEIQGSAITEKYSVRVRTRDGSIKSPNHSQQSPRATLQPTLSTEEQEEAKQKQRQLQEWQQEKEKRRQQEMEALEREKREIQDQEARREKARKLRHEKQKAKLEQYYERRREAEIQYLTQTMLESQTELKSKVKLKHKKHKKKKKSTRSQTSDSAKNTIHQQLIDSPYNETVRYRSVSPNALDLAGFSTRHESHKDMRSHNQSLSTVQQDIPSKGKSRIGYNKKESNGMSRHGRNLSQKANDHTSQRERYAEYTEEFDEALYLGSILNGTSTEAANLDRIHSIPTTTTTLPSINHQLPTIRNNYNQPQDNLVKLPLTNLIPTTNKHDGHGSWNMIQESVSPRNPTASSNRTNSTRHEEDTGRYRLYTTSQSQTTQVHDQDPTDTTTMFPQTNISTSNTPIHLPVVQNQTPQQFVQPMTMQQHPSNAWMSTYPATIANVANNGAHYSNLQYMQPFNQPNASMVSAMVTSAHVNTPMFPSQSMAPAMMLVPAPTQFYHGNAQPWGQSPIHQDGQTNTWMRPVTDQPVPHPPS